MKIGTAKLIRRVGTLLFVLYLIALIYFLFFAEEYGRTVTGQNYRYNLIPFTEIRRFWIYRDILGPFAVLTNIAGNVIGFIPFGLILPVIKKSTRKFWVIAFYSFDFSLAVETAQLLTKVGSFDVDDLILNTLGGILGYFMFCICNRIRRKLYG